MERLIDRLNVVSGQLLELTTEMAGLKEEVAWRNNQDSDTYVTAESA